MNRHSGLHPPSETFGYWKGPLFWLRKHFPQYTWHRTNGTPRMMLNVTIWSCSRLGIALGYARMRAFRNAGENAELVRLWFDAYQTRSIPAFIKSWEYFVTDGAWRMSSIPVQFSPRRCSFNRVPFWILTIWDMYRHLLHLSWTELFSGFEPRFVKWKANVLSTCLNGDRLHCEKS